LRKELTEATDQIEEQQARMGALTQQVHKHSTSEAVLQSKLKESQSLLEFQQKLGSQLEEQVKQIREEEAQARREAIEAQSKPSPSAQAMITAARRQANELDRVCDQLRDENKALDERC